MGTYMVFCLCSQTRKFLLQSKMKYLKRRLEWSCKWDGYPRIWLWFICCSKHDYCEYCGDIRPISCAFLPGHVSYMANFLRSMRYQCQAAHHIRTMLQSPSFIGSNYNISYFTFIFDTNIDFHSAFDFPIYYFTTTYGLYTFSLVNLR